MDLILRIVYQSLTEGDLMTLDKLKDELQIVFRIVDCRVIF